MDTTTNSPGRADERAIREVVAHAHSSQSEPAALLALHTPDAVVVNFPGRRVLGRDAFAEAMTSALSSSLDDVRTSVEIIDIRSVTHDVALVSCIKAVHDGRSDADGLAAPLPSSTGALTYVMVRSDDSWRIALAQTTPVLSASAAASS